MHEAEALTLATSLFPDKPHENTFFVEGPRKIFAHLLTLKPTPEELVWWMSHEEELDRLTERHGTGDVHLSRRGPAARRRAGRAQHGSRQPEAAAEGERDEAAVGRRKNGREQQSGWLFLTSTPRFRERLLPLMSLWLDTLVLRLMNQGDPAMRHAWFVLDELASLQRLPQLHTALTENRKSEIPW